MGTRGSDSQRVAERATQDRDPPGDRKFPSARLLGSTELPNSQHRPSARRPLETPRQVRTGTGQPEAGTKVCPPPHAARGNPADRLDGAKPEVCRPVPSHDGRNRFGSGYFPSVLHHGVQGAEGIEKAV